MATEEKTKRELAEEKDVIVAPERHYDACRLVQRGRLEVLEGASLPHANLSIAHPAEARRGDAIAFAHPYHARALDTAMSLADPDGVSTSAGVKQTHLAVSARRNEKLAGRVKRQALYGVPMTREHRAWRLWRAEVPQLHCVISDCAREDVLRRGVPEYLTDLARRRVDVQHGRKVDGRPALHVPALERGGAHLPDEHVSVLAAGRDDRVRVRRPVRVEDRRGVAAR